MEIKVQNYNTNITSKKYNNKIESTISFQDCLDSTKNSKIHTNATDQTLIEDKKFYDSLKSNSGWDISNIEFGSKEWDKWKSEHNDDFFPPLNAPTEVREAWRETKESISKDDKEAQLEFRMKEVLFHFKSHNPERFGLPTDFKLNTITDYEKLFNNDIATNENLAEIYKNTGDSSEYKSLAEITRNVENKLKEALLKN